MREQCVPGALPPSASAKDEAIYCHKLVYRRRYYTHRMYYLPQTV